MPLILRQTKGDKLTISELDGNFTYLETLATPNYLIYRSMISQTGTDAPTAIILENTLNADLSFSYSNLGFYYFSDPNGIFTGDININISPAIKASGAGTSVIHYFTSGYNNEKEGFIITTEWNMSLNTRTNVNGRLNNHILEIIKKI